MTSHSKILLSLLFIISTLAGWSQAMPGVVNTDTTQTVLSLSELRTKLEQESELAKETITLLSDTTQDYQFITSINSLAKNVIEVKEQSDYFLGSYIRSWLVENLISKWIRSQNDLEGISETISVALKGTEQRLQTNQELRKFWIRYKELNASNNLGTILRDPMNELLQSISQIDRLLQNRIKSHLILQEEIAKNRSVIVQYLEILASHQHRDLATLLYRDEGFIWEVLQQSDSSHIDVGLFESFQFAAGDTIDYLKSDGEQIIFILIFSFLFQILLVTLNKRSQKDQVVSNQPNNQLQLFNYSITSTFTVSLVIALLALSNRPALLTEFLFLLFTIPLAIVLNIHSSGKIKQLAIYFIGLYWVHIFSTLFVINNALVSFIDLFVIGATFTLLLVGAKNKHLIIAQFPELTKSFVIGVILPFLIIISGAAFVLKIVGYTGISSALSDGSIRFIYLGPVVLIVSIILRDVLHVVENIPLVKESHLAKHFYNYTYKAVQLWAIYLWLIIFLRAYALEPLVVSVLTAVWNFGGQFGEFMITLGDVVSFFIILFLSFIVSNVVRVLLQDEILSRMNLPRGVPMAFGVLVRYTIVVLGFFIAVASTGFDLTKMSIIAGALGVGIGFGLQNLVSNFVSGLILIFERPIMVGDIIESEQLEGVVTQIGIRSSTIQTYDGAEVILPNSSLVNNKVSNWTLTSKSRRQVVTVRTSMRSKPEEVIEILIRIAAHHPATLDQPEPFVVFDGQLDQALQFRLFYWLASDLFKTRSEINLQIYKELKAMGVELPIPMNIEIQSKTDKDFLSGW